MKHILCFGDSNTYGLIPGTTQRYPWGVRFTSILAERFTDKKYRVIEEGLCGRTTIFEDVMRDGRDGSKILPILLQTHSPVEYVILMLGTNDCKKIYGASAQAIGGGITLLLEQIQAENKGIKVLLISPIHLGEGVGEVGFDPEFDENSVEVSKNLKGVYQEIAKKYGCEFLAASDYVRASAIDREHLDEEGHKKMAEVIYNVLNIK